MICNEVSDGWLQLAGSVRWSGIVQEQTMKLAIVAKIEEEE